VSECEDKRTGEKRTNERTTTVVRQEIHTRLAPSPWNCSESSSSCVSLHTVSLAGGEEEEDEG
jgi:hypothetical protein